MVTTLVQRRSLASLPLTWLPQIKKVGIVGGGPLGEALAFQCAIAGFDTSVMDPSMIALESITTLRICTEVCTSWEEEIMSNPLIMQIARTKTETDFGLGELPSCEEISNAKWLSK